MSLRDRDRHSLRELSEGEVILKIEERLDRPNAARTNSLRPLSLWCCRMRRFYVNEKPTHGAVLSRNRG